MSCLLEPARPKRRTLCNVLRKSTNWKCLILTNLILSCLGAIIWCRNTRITKILVDFNAFPITSRRQVSPCQDGYVYIPIAFVIMLYLLYLVECWHSNARIQLSKKKVDVGSVYRKIRDMKESQPVIWWRAICYHYVRRVRQTTRRRNGETLTSSQTYYERVNSSARGSSFFYNVCGIRDYSKDVVDLEKYAVTKIKFSKGFVFANLATVSEFEEQRSTFFREQERLDDYMEMREGFEFPNIHFTETVLAWNRPETPPWFGRINTFWLCSLLLLSWPLRICLELNTAHLHYKITKLFGINYPSDIRDLFELERPLVTSNYLQHILQQQSPASASATPRRVLLPPRRHQQQRRNRNLNRLSPARTPTPTPTHSSSSSSSTEPPSLSYTEPLLPLPMPFHENANANALEKSASQFNPNVSPPHYCKSANTYDPNSSERGPGSLFGFGGWSNFASSFFRPGGRNRPRPFFPRSVTLMIEPSSGTGADRLGESSSKQSLFGFTKRNYANANSFYSKNSIGLDEDEEELLVPSYSEALLLLEPKQPLAQTQERNYDNDSQSSPPTATYLFNSNTDAEDQCNVSVSVHVNEHLSIPTNDNDPNPNSTSTYHHQSSLRRPSSAGAWAAANDREHGQGSTSNVTGLTTQSAQYSSQHRDTSTNILPAVVELDLTNQIVVPSPSDARQGRAVAVASAAVNVDHNSPAHNQQQHESAELIQELPPSYIEALQTSRPVFISTLTRLRRCFTEQDFAGGINSNSSRRDYMRDRIQQSWLNYYYARTNPGAFLQRFHTSRRSITGITEEQQRRNQSLEESGGTHEHGHDRSEV